MISVIMYGRNDAHGYNLHRRAALSLNCIAEVLTDPDDEIIFVDYNTPDELPTFIEALADTLTERCLGLLRVLRVPAWVHTERYRDRTHLVVAEPVARNAAARRANPANRWLLSTNTDMIFVPLRGESLSEICADLADGYYALPRFELPEWVWERLPRSDAERALVDVARLGPALHLDEPTLGHKWVRYDAPGDFQLVLRDDFVAIDGFDEEMLLGWHVDSNLSRRMLLHRGSIETLESTVAGYHCNHARVPTAYHGAERIQNDLARFVDSVESAELQRQRETWGLTGVLLEEVPRQGHASAAHIEALLATLPPTSGPRPASDAVKANFTMWYDSAHVLPFIADSIVVSPLRTIGYVGVNPVLRELIARLVGELNLDGDLTVAQLDDRDDLERFAQAADLFVVDLGTDLTCADTRNVARLGDGSVHIPAGLDRVFGALDTLVEAERARLESGAHPRRFVLVNSSTSFLDAYVGANFDSTSTTVHCRVRRATVRMLPNEEAAGIAMRRTRALARWALAGDRGRGDLQLAPGELVSLGELDDFAGFVAGWAFPDGTGMWTWGTRSNLSIAFAAVDSGECVLEFGFDGACIAPNETLRVALLVNGAQVESRDCSCGPFVWPVELPPRVAAEGRATITFVVDEPRTPLSVGIAPDERPLGLHLHTLSFDADDPSVQTPPEPVDRSLRILEPVSFVEGLGAERFLDAGWSKLEPTGVWTVGPRARIAFQLPADAGTDLELVLGVHAFVTAEHPEIEAVFTSRTGRLGARRFRHGSKPRVLRLPLNGMSEQPEGHVVVDIDLDRPASPEECGTGSDPRLLGLHLEWLMVCRTGRRGRWHGVRRRPRSPDAHRQSHESLPDPSGRNDG